MSRPRVCPHGCRVKPYGNLPQHLQGDRCPVLANRKDTLKRQREAQRRTLVAAGKTAPPRQPTASGTRDLKEVVTWCQGTFKAYVASRLGRSGMRTAQGYAHALEEFLNFVYGADPHFSLPEAFSLDYASGQPTCVLPPAYVMDYATTKTGEPHQVRITAGTCSFAFF